MQYCCLELLQYLLSVFLSFFQFFYTLPNQIFQFSRSEDPPDFHWDNKQTSWAKYCCVTFIQTKITQITTNHTWIQRNSDSFRGMFEAHEEKMLVSTEWLTFPAYSVKYNKIFMVYRKVNNHLWKQSKKKEAKRGIRRCVNKAGGWFSIRNSRSIHKVAVESFGISGYIPYIKDDGNKSKRHFFMSNISGIVCYQQHNHT